jgi:hypothetical protein
MFSAKPLVRIPEAERATILERFGTHNEAFLFLQDHYRHYREYIEAKAGKAGRLDQASDVPDRAR